MDNQQRKKILKYLGEKTVITSSELAEFLGISWNTAEKYLLELGMENKVIKIKKQGVNLWLLK
jgi:Mn-dependent DtxR family transcriptional regulator